MDSPELQRTYLAGLAAGSKGRFRVFGDMTWTREKRWREEDLYRLEASLPQARDMQGALFLCQYALDGFTGKEIMMALETHSHNTYRGRIHQSPYGPPLSL